MKNLLHEMKQCLLPVRRIVAASGDMPDVRKVLLFQEGVETLADTEEAVFRAA